MLTRIYRAAGIAAVLSLIALPAVAAVPTTSPVNAGLGAGYSSAVSANGRFVVYITGERGVWSDGLFVRDMVDGSTRQVDVSSAGRVGIFGTILDAAISNNGRFVAFGSGQPLVRGDTNGRQDVFVRDLGLGETQRVSVSSQERQGNRHSGFTVSISATGRFVTFTSQATNLAPNDTRGWNDVYVRDRRAGTTRKASPHGGIYSAISADGSFIAFQGQVLRRNGSHAQVEQLMVRNRVKGTTRVISLSPAGVRGNGESDRSAISGNGRIVAFASNASNLVRGDTNASADIFVWSKRTGQIRRVSVDSTGIQANSASTEPTISADGRFVAFTSWASNLVPDDTNGVADIFVHDRATGLTQRISRNMAGTEENPESHEAYQPSLSADGRFVTYSTLSEDDGIFHTPPPAGSFLYGPLQ